MNTPFMMRWKRPLKILLSNDNMSYVKSKLIYHDLDFYSAPLVILQRHYFKGKHVQYNVQFQWNKVIPLDQWSLNFYCPDDKRAQIQHWNFKDMLPKNLQICVPKLKVTCQFLKKIF